MSRLLRTLDKVLLRILNAIIIFTSIAIVSLVLFLIVSRIFGWSVVGMLELATISAMWLYMCGAIVATKNREHLVVDFLAQRIASEKIKAWHSFFVSVVMLILGVFFIGLVIDMLEFAARRPQTTPALSLPLLLPQSAIVIGAMFMAIYALRDFIIMGRAVFWNTPSEKVEN